MSAQDYGMIVGGVCTGMIVLDPESTDAVEFGKAIGATLIARMDFLDGHWGAGATWDGTSVTAAPVPEPGPQPEPPVPGSEPTPAPAGDLAGQLAEQREINAAQQTQLDDVTSMLLTADSSAEVASLTQRLDDLTSMILEG